MCISELIKALCALKINNNYQDMNYSKLVAAIDDRIKANGRREITGQTLHDVLEAMVRSLGAGYQVAGVLGVDDDPGTPDQRFAWLAAEPGVYRHCGGLSVTELSWIIWGGEWIVKPMDVPFGVSVKEWIREAVEEERTRAMIAEALLQKNIDTEAATREDADTALGARIDKEVADREKAVADEAAAREAADVALGGRIDKEIADREAAVAAEADARDKADKVLQANIDKEQERAEGAESQLRTDLNAEVAERKQAIADEAAARTAADTALGKRIDTETSERKAADAAEAAAREAADTALGGRIDTEAQARKDADAAEKAAREKAVADEKARAEKAEQANAAAIAKEAEDREAAVTAEATAREAADTALGGRIDTEVNDRTAADTALGKRIDTEADTRDKADEALQTAIDAEAAAREAADTKEAQDRAAAVTAEANARTAADTALGGRIDTEISDRKAADTALGTRIDTEITDRKAADNALQTAIDGKQATLVSGSNIKTVNGNSLLGSGNLEIKAGPDIDTTMPATPVDTKVPSTKLLKDYVDGLVADLQAQIDDLKYGELAKPLTFTIQEDGTIVWKTTDANIAKTIQYSKNGGEWTDLTATTGGASIDVVAGDILRFKGNNDTYASDSSYNCFDGTAKFAASGNIMSLIDGDNFKSLKALTSEFAFRSMFRGCTGLTQAPALPATTLASDCYRYMFYGCTGLTSAPELPATTLASGCYNGMFDSCTKLAHVKCLATDISASSCVASWLSGVASSGTFVKAAAMTSWPSGADGIPGGWTVENAA